MLLPFRWLLYGTAASAETATPAHKNPKLLRKIRRLTRWSEAVAPPRLNVTIQGGSSFFLLNSSLASGTLAIPRHVAVYNKGPVSAIGRIADFVGVNVSVSSFSEARGQRSEIRSGEIHAAIDLFEEEYLALLAA